jgi:hypothetical protein
VPLSPRGCHPSRPDSDRDAKDLNLNSLRHSLSWPLQQPKTYAQWLEIQQSFSAKMMEVSFRMIAHPDDGGHPDGLNWLTLDESGKNAYICGFIEGVFQGHCFTTWGLPGERPDDPSYVNATRSFNDHWDQFITNTTYRLFLEGLDRF